MYQKIRELLRRQTVLLCKKIIEVLDGQSISQVEVVVGQQRDVTKVFRRLVYLSALLAIAVITIYALNFNGGISLENDKWGTFGDFFGGTLNPFLAFFGLIALLHTIRLQSDELSLSTAELKRSAKASEEQSKTLERQNFENTFFQLIRLHNDVVSATELVDGFGEGQTKDRGRACYLTYCRRLKYIYEEYLEKGDDTFVAAQRAYSKLRMEKLNSIVHYLKNIYAVLYFIDESKVDSKEQYIKILRAQLSSAEEVLIYYAAAYESEKNPIKGIIEKFSFFSGLGSLYLLDSSRHTELYNLSAFGVSESESEVEETIPEES